MEQLPAAVNNWTVAGLSLMVLAWEVPILGGLADEDVLGAGACLQWAEEDS